METASYGGAGAGIKGLTTNKPGLMKDVQNVMVSDVHRSRTLAYRHIKHVHVNSPGWNVLCKIEVKEIMDTIKLIVEGEEED